MKKLKNLVFAIFVSILVFGNIISVKAANVVNNNGFELVDHQFQYDYELHFKLNDINNEGKITASVNFISMDEYQTLFDSNKARIMFDTINLKDVTYDGKTGKELYEYLKAMQDRQDEIVVQGNQNSATFQAWDEIMNTQNTTVKVNTDGTGYQDVKEAIFCYRDKFYDEVEIPKSCEDEYYIVTAIYMEKTAPNGSLVHEYNVSRVYEVKANDTCKCEFKNDKYYNNEGKEVTKDEYNKDCNSCKIENGKYYNNEGKEVTKEQWNQDCNSCRKENGKYYNKDGKEVTKEQWNKDCGNPDTGIDNPYIIIAIVVAAGAGIAFISKKKKYV